MLFGALWRKCHLPAWMCNQLFACTFTTTVVTITVITRANKRAIACCQVWKPGHRCLPETTGSAQRRRCSISPGLQWGRALLLPGASCFTSPHRLSWRKVGWLLSWAPPLALAQPARVCELACEIPSNEEASLLWISLDLHREWAINSTITHYQLHSSRNPKPDEIIFFAGKKKKQTTFFFFIFIEHFSILFCPVSFNSCHCSLCTRIGFLAVRFQNEIGNLIPKYKMHPKLSQCRKKNQIREIFKNCFQNFLNKS